MTARYKRRDATAAIDRLAALTAAGMTTSDALAAAARTGGGAGRLARALGAAVRRGRPLSSAAARLVPPFTEPEAALLGAGERGGALGAAIALLARRMHSDRASARALGSALAYPSFLVTFSFAALAFISIAVLPAFADLYRSEGRELPARTATMLGLGDALVSWGPTAVTVFLFGAALALLTVRRSRRARLALDRLRLALPVIGSLELEGEKARMSATVAALLEAGCEAEQALLLASTTLGNRVLRRRAGRAFRRLVRGDRLSTAWRRAGIDPGGEETDLLRVAEAAGDYRAAFERMATLSALAHEETLSRLTRAAEPTAVALMAAVVGYGVLALYEPVLGSATVAAGGF